MAMSSIGRPVVINASNMKRFAEVASKPKPVVRSGRPLKYDPKPRKPRKSQ